MNTKTQDHPTRAVQGEASTARDDGGPAFPHVSVPRPDLGENITQRFTGGGMSLRDYFAAKAMQSTLESEYALEALEQAGVDTHQATAALVARMAYAIADAMLKARSA